MYHTSFGAFKWKKNAHKIIVIIITIRKKIDNTFKSHHAEGERERAPHGLTKTKSKFRNVLKTNTDLRVLKFGAENRSRYAHKKMAQTY